MADSTLLHTDDTPPRTGVGHGTGALGPSDSSDTGSDIRGGPGLNKDEGLLRTGNTSDADSDAGATDAGPDIGDADLDSDSDRYGTGERGAVGRDSSEPVDETLRTEDDEPLEGGHVGDDADIDDDKRRRGDEWR